MFPKYSRIQKGDVLRVIKEGASYHSPSFLLKILKNPLKTTQFAVVVSKKVAKIAVYRNKNKRRIREIVKKQNINDGYFYIIMLKKDLNTSLFRDITYELNGLLAGVRQVKK